MGKYAPLRKPLWDHQEEARGLIHAHFETQPRGMVVAATGAGKTVLFSSLSADVAGSGGRTLILTDQFDLVDQAVDKLLGIAGIYADVEQGDRTASPKAMVIVATVQSLGGRLDQYPPDYFDLVVADECDRSLVPMWEKVLQHFDGHAKVLGVTATPTRLDRQPLLRYYQTKIYEVTLLQLIERGYLSPVNVRELPITINLQEADPEDDKDYGTAEVAEAVTAVFGDVCEAIKTHAADRKILVFLPDVATSKKFALACIAAGLNARHVDGESSDREEVKKGFREWTPEGPNSRNAFQILCNPVLLSRGYDEPSCDCVINLRPTKSTSLYIQMIGRGTRLFCRHGCNGPCDHPDRKLDLLVLDFLYQFKALGPVRPSCLVTDSPEKAAEINRCIQTQGIMDLSAAEEQATQNLQASLLKAFQEAQEKHHGAKGEYFNAMAWASNLNMPDLIDYVPETDADAAPVPERILKRLAKAGFIPETVVCAGQANRILQAIQARKEAGLASAKQVFWMRKWGYKDPWNMTADQAKSICFRNFRDRGNIR